MVYYIHSHGSCNCHLLKIFLVLAPAVAYRQPCILFSHQQSSLSITKQKATMHDSYKFMTLLGMIVNISYHNTTALYSASG